MRLSMCRNNKITESARQYHFRRLRALINQFYRHVKLPIRAPYDKQRLLALAEQIAVARAEAARYNLMEFFKYDFGP
ncbi:hypothetical protein JOC69_000586 [Heliobacterium gestii]|nr:hypothetical protein [Heliomicrobium gestii]